MFAFQLPVSGKLVRWRPLTVGEEIEIDTVYRSEATRPLRNYELLRRRITGYGEASLCSLEELRAWDTLDLECFAEQVEEREQERKAVLRKKQAGADPGVSLENALVELENAMRIVGAAAKAALIAQRAAQAASPQAAALSGGAAPLGSSST